MIEQTAKDELMVKEILATARNLFAQYGLKKTTMEDIAIAMGKGKSTLYYYFTGKTEIYEAVVDEEMRNLLRLTRQAITKATTARNKLKAFSKTRADALAKLRNLSKVVYEEIFNNYGIVLKIKQKHEEIQVDFVKEIIRGGVQSGEFKELSEEDMEIFACTLVAAFRGLELPYSSSKVSTICSSGSDLLVDILVDGIS